MQKSFLIIDFSTRGTQATLVNNDNGQHSASCFSSYKIIHEAPGWSEINLQDLWVSLQKVVHEIVSKNSEKYEIIALGFSWSGDNLILVDDKGAPLDNMVLPFDYRARDEAQKLIDEFGEENLYSLIGHEPIIAGLIPAKILWYKNNKPEIFAKTQYYLGLQQYIIKKLGLGVITDYSLACRKNMLDIKNLCWSDSLCHYLGIDTKQLGEDILPANSIIGTIEKIGEVKLPSKVPVLLGAHNSLSGMVGLGSMPDKPPKLTEVIGTFDIIGFLTNRYHERHAGFFTCYRGPFNDSYVVAGSSVAQPDLEWVLRVLFQEEHVSSLFDMLPPSALDGGNHVILSNGVQTGNGILRGINLTTTRTDILQAVIEGVTFPLIGIINQLSKLQGERFKSIVCGGKGADNDRQLQLKADMYNLVVEKTENTNVSSLGAAIFLAVELGIKPDYESAMRQMIHVQTVFEPRQEIAQKYKERYMEFLDMV